MNDYENRQERKRQRYLDLADKNEAKSTSEHQASHRAVDGIPFGQPILVGHHSEGRHRGALTRADNAMRRSVEADKKAKYYRNKAAGVGKAGISSDDPDAASKIRAKIKTLEGSRELMKAGNKAYRMAVKQGINGLPSDELMVKNVDAIRAKVGYGSQDFITKAIQWKPQYDFEKGPYVGWPLSNLGQNIKRYKDRLEALADQITETSEEQRGEVTIIHNVEENRIQLKFPGKPPAEARAILKSNGFRWSRYNTAWQRQLNNAGIYAADSALGQIEALQT